MEANLARVISGKRRFVQIQLILNWGGASRDSSLDTKSSLGRCPQEIK
jgi:hypothetical protein